MSERDHCPSWCDPATTAIATLLLALFWWLAVSATFERSPTSDEPPHIASGVAYDRYDDFRMHPENGVLPQRIFGLPALWENARFPRDSESWQTAAYWLLGWDFFYSLNNPIDWIVLQARSLNAAIGVLLGLFTFLVARAWHGRMGGLLALGMFVFTPSLLAHSALATSDVTAALLLLLAPWCFWWHLERRDVVSGVVAGAVSGLALVAKFNGVLLVPMYALLGCADAWLRGEEGSRAGRFSRNVGLALVQAGLAAAVIWAFYGCRFRAAGSADPALQFAWKLDDMMAVIGWKRHLLEQLFAWKLLPEAWLYGFTHVLAGSAARPAFLAGEYSDGGWWEFFPALFLAKTTLGSLVAFVAALGLVGAIARRTPPEIRRAWVRRAMPLAVTAAVVWTAAMAGNLNIGDRHILAIYPPLFILAGTLARHVWLRWAGALLLALHAQAALAIRPYFLASFNPLVGGPAKAYQIFTDSAIDWGQDLPSLAGWLDRHRSPPEKVYLAYFGTAWPPHHGVRPDHFLPMMTYLVRPPLEPYELQPGLYCVSATGLSEVYQPQRGEWTADREAEYRRLRARAGTLAAGDYARYDLLRFSRLCKFLQRRPPDAAIGYSILVFRLSQAELQEALEAPVISLYRVRPR